MKPLSKSFCIMMADTNEQLEEREAQLKWFHPLIAANTAWWGNQVIEFIDGSVCAYKFVVLKDYTSLEDYIATEKLPPRLYEVLREGLDKSREEIRAHREQKEEKEQREMEIFTHEDA